MKSVLVCLTSLWLLSHCTQVFSQGPIPYSAEEILEKSIRFHDPEGKWNAYEGKLKMNVCFPGSGNTYGTEIVEINVPEDYYQWTRLINGYKVVKGIRDGAIFYSLNGNSTPTPEEKEAFWINEPNIRMMKEHHYWHFGKFNYLKTSGVELQKEVKRMIFDGRDCYMLTFTGDSARVRHPYFAGENSFCVDAESFALIGWINPAGDLKIQGTIEINGMKIPAVETWYDPETNQLLGVTLFSRGDDINNLPAAFRSASETTASNIGYISTHLLKLENEDELEKLRQPLMEFNEVLAGMGYPECGYVIYRVNDEYASEITHVMEGRWLSREVYDITHNHTAYRKVAESYQVLFAPVLEGQEYFRMEKMMPKLY